MNIGRKPLSETEFNKHWLILFREFQKLYASVECNATTIYNTIFAVCTSASSYENKLYWKIGDFCYNRCKECRDEIAES